MVESVKNYLQLMNIRYNSLLEWLLIFLRTMSYHRGGGNKPKGFGFAGFQMAGTKRSGTNVPPPPPNSTLSKQGYHTMSAITENALSASWGMPKKRSKTEEE